MGCDEINTLEEYEDNKFEENKEDNQFPRAKNLCVKMFTGVLQKDINFTDSLIKNHEELDEKLRSFIPTKIIKDNSDTPTFNTRDDILTKSHNINFDQYYLIALNGVNRVIRVEEENGNYLIFHDNQPGYKHKYIALVVTQIGDNPTFFYQSPKKPCLDD